MNRSHAELTPNLFCVHLVQLDWVWKPFEGNTDVIESWEARVVLV